MIITDDQVLSWKQAKPFSHIVIDNFLPIDVAEQVDKDFPSLENNFWYVYNNKIEVKKTCSSWDLMPASIYNVISYLLTEKISKQLEKLTGSILFPDYGLHGGGMHCHGPGGKLNTHLDYSIHPKTGTQRKLNLILYVSKNWNPEWGGSLGLWSHNEETNQPKELITSIDSIFNRAVIFDTTQNSWHGLPEEIKCPEGMSRKSLAVYYTTYPTEDVNKRYKALYAPTEKQKDDPSVIELIKKRSNINTFKDVYVEK